MRKGFINETGGYVSIHEGPGDPSPAVLIVRAARRLAEAGVFNPARLRRGLNGHSLSQMSLYLGAVDEPHVLARKRVEDLVAIWDAIKNMPGTAQALSVREIEIVEGFINEAKRLGK